MLVALALAGVLAQTPQCTQPPIPRATSAPAVLPASLASAYPDGISIRYKVVFDRNGAIVSRAIDTSVLSKPLLPAARSVVTAWGDAQHFVDNFYDCKYAAGPQYVDQDFFPASSGVVGRPRVAGGVDFDNFRYTDGPGNCSKADLTNGEAGYPEGEYDAYIQDLFAGSVAGTSVAIVVLRCEYNGHGFDLNAQLFDVSGGHARRIGILAGDGMTGPDSAFPPWPGGSFHFSFTNGKLYADVWNRDQGCSKTADWVVTTYTVRADKLVALNVRHHHRPNDAACSM